MPRQRRRQKTPQQRGPKVKFVGSKFKFVDSRKGIWREAVDSNKAGEFYSNITKLWLRKYGWELPFDTDLEDKVDDPSDDCLNDGWESELSQEDAEKYRGAYNTLRLVSSLQPDIFWHLLLV